jgi:hypothetical protein
MEDCEGDNTSIQSCDVGEEQLRILSILTDQELKVGDVLRISLADEDGSPITGTVTLTRPDGSKIELTSGSYTVDQPGIWKIEASKPGYEPAEAQANVKELATKEDKGIGEQVIETVESAVKFIIEEPIRFALLLSTVVALVGLSMFYRLKKKRKIEKF